MATPARFEGQQTLRPRVFVNAGGSVSGGGRVYVLGLIDELARGGDRGIDWEFLIPPQLTELIHMEGDSHLVVRPQPIQSAARRFLWEQTVLPLLRDVRKADVLLSAANFGPLVPVGSHVLLARNRLHFEPSGIQGWKGLRVVIQAALGRLSARRATITVTATTTMARTVAARTGRDVVSIPFGPGLVRGRREAPGDRFTFVDRSWWGPHKRLSVLLLAVKELSRTHAGRFVVHSACDPTTRFARGFRESAADRRLLADADIASHVEFERFEPRLGDELVGDAVVVASTTESFCFPLAEAIGADLPVIAAESAFARELCRESAIYVEPGNPVALADGMRRLVEGERPPAFPHDLRNEVSWRSHADRLADVCRALAIQ
jgi:glycosyltransferase involved in cell wall biosynthesis